MSGTDCAHVLRDSQSAMGKAAVPCRNLRRETEVMGVFSEMPRRTNREFRDNPVNRVVMVTGGRSCRATAHRVGICRVKAATTSVNGEGARLPLASLAWKRMKTL
jgi:hypothetical protein